MNNNLFNGITQVMPSEDFCSGPPAELQMAKSRIYDPCGFSMSYLQAMEEGQDYHAYTFHLNKKQVVYRKAKITPTKSGQFVTLWKRDSDGITAPFDVSDPFDLVIISTSCGDKFGQFIFSKLILQQKGILSVKGIGGKRGFRVYPPWDITGNKQAEKTQQWQCDYFLDLSSDVFVDLASATLFFV